jgi:hypothetical protein
VRWLVYVLIAVKLWERKGAAESELAMETGGV